MAKRSKRRSPPTLIAIGGHEDKTGDKTILREVAAKVASKKLVVATLASEDAAGMWDQYRKTFRDLGVRDLAHLNIDQRLDSKDDSRLQVLRDAGGVFFTGGDQLRITSKLGGTALCERIHEIYAEGGVVAGTSAGASVLTETMIVAGNEQTHRIGNALLLAPGLGFVAGLVIDQHFAERGRVGRLLGIVAQNPRTLGIGIDENTAVVIRENRGFHVIGEGAVYVMDGRPVTYTNISEQETNKTMSVFDLKLHVLSRGDSFDFEQRRPAPPQPEEDHAGEC